MKLTLLSIWIIVAHCMSLAAQDLASTLPITTRIEVKRDRGSRRASVSEDRGPSSASVKVRLEPNHDFPMEPRKSVRIAPQPDSIKGADHLEWYGTSTSSFQYVPATVEGLATGDYACYYPMAWEKYPNGQNYTKREELRLLPEAQTAPTKVISGAPNPQIRPLRLRRGWKSAHLGCHDRIAGRPQLLGIRQAGCYTNGSITGSGTWLSGWGKTGGFQGAVDSYALIRLHRNTICLPE